jgi:hypothetical protein
MATQVLCNLGAGWLQCQDAEGIFFFNEQTRATSIDLPAELGGAQKQGAPVQQFQAQQQLQQLQAQEQALKAQQAQQAQPVVKMQLGPWQVCEDEQGEFYFNMETGQSFEQPPAELTTLYMASQAAKVQQPQQPQSQPSQAAQAKVKFELGSWRVCEDAQGEFYIHAPTGQSFDQPPDELVQLYKAQKQAPQPVQAPQIVQASQAQQTPSRVKLAIGNWLVCEDNQGEFYVNKLTRQNFNQPPQELLQILAKPATAGASFNQPAMQPVSQPASYAPQQIQYVAAQPQVPQQVQYMKYGGQR